MSGMRKQVFTCSSFALTPVKLPGCYAACWNSGERDVVKVLLATKGQISFQLLVWFGL
jgi:hypothetical protein